MDREQRRDTKERVLAAAEQLFAERGPEATSLRDVTSAAGVNIAAVNYHFGSKAALYRAVVHRLLTPVNDERLRRLSALRSRSPTVADLVEAFVVPVLDSVGTTTEEGRLRAKLVGRVLGDPTDESRRVVIAEASRAERPYLDAFAEVLPHLPGDELAWRYRSLIGVLVSTLVGTFDPPDGGAEHAARRPDAGDAGRRWLVTFLTAAMTAPASTPAVGVTADGTGARDRSGRGATMPHEQRRRRGGDS